MPMPQDVNDYLTSHAPRAFCDDCIAKGLRLALRPALVTATLATTGLFVRERALCSSCGRAKQVTRVGT